MVYDSEKQRFIEKTGQMFDDMGLGKTPGRILGLLLVHNPPYMTMNQITNELDMAKSTISVALNMLTTVKFLEKFGIPGKRADYYHIDTDFLKKAVAVKKQAINRFQKLIGDALKIIDNDMPEDHVETLHEMYELYEWLGEKYPQMFEEWEREWERRKREKYS